MEATPGRDVDATTAVVPRDRSEDSVSPGVEVAVGMDVDARGRYRATRELGRGGFGTVLEAHDAELGRPVAIKVLRRDVDDEREVARLLREGRVVASLNHPNIVEVFDVGTTAAGVPFIVMERIDGEHLGHWLEDAARTWSEIVDVYVEAGRGLAAAHAAGLTHRDFKPSNVMIGRDDRVRVLDFGLARPAAATRAASGGSPSASRSSTSAISARSSADERLTMTGAVAGTPAYMAPEVHRGEPETAATDQFSFCVALYAALHGTRPFAGRTADALYRAKRRGRIVPGTPAHGLPRSVRAALLRGLRPDADERWPDMTRLLAALTAADRRRSRSLAWAAGGVLLVAGAAIPAPRGPANATACANIDELWEGRDDRVRSRFDEVLGPTAGEFHDHLDRHLDAFETTWRAQRSAACETIGDAASTSADLTLRCLDLQRTTIVGVLDALAEADRRDAHDVGGTLLRLPNPAQCGNADRVARWGGSDPANPDPALQRLWQAEATLSGLILAGRYEEARAKARRVQARADEVGDAATSARIAVTTGELMHRSGDYPDALRWLTRGYAQAIETRQDDIAVTATTSLIQVLGMGLGRHSEALEWVQHGHARLKSPLVSSSAAASLVISEANVLTELGDYDRAYARLVEIEEAGAGLDTPHERGVFRMMTANVQIERGHYENAASAAKEAAALQTEALGPRHPEVGIAKTILAAALDLQGKTAESLAVHEEAVAIQEAAFGPMSRRLEPALHNMANALLSAHRVDEAIAVMERVVRIERTNPARNNHKLALVEAGLGQALLEAGRPRDAAEHFETALGLARDARDDADPLAIQIRGALAEAWATAGMTDEARALAQTGLDQATGKYGPDSARTAEAWVDFAQASRSLGDTEAARDAFATAAAIHEAAGSPPIMVARSAIRAGDADLALGREREAATAFEHALAVLRDVEAPLERGRARLGLARARRGRRSTAAWSEELDAIRALFVAAGSSGTADLAELDALR